VVAGVDEPLRKAFGEHGGLVRSFEVEAVGCRHHFVEQAEMIRDRLRHALVRRGAEDDVAAIRPLGAQESQHLTAGRQASDIQRNMRRDELLDRGLALEDQGGGRE
jgi:hypothetical protein